MTITKDGESRPGKVCHHCHAASVTQNSKGEFVCDAHSTPAGTKSAAAEPSLRNASEDDLVNLHQDA